MSDLSNLSKISNLSSLFETLSKQALNKFAMHVIRGEDQDEGDVFFVHKDKIYVGTHEYLNEVLDQIPEIDDDIHGILTDYPHIIAGTISNNRLYFDKYELFHLPGNSPIIEKVMKALHAYDIETSSIDDVETEVHFPLKYTNPNITYAYHGTALKYVPSILRFGLKPPEMQVTNFKSVIHDDLIFLTSKFDKAVFHANTASYNTKSIPVIFEFKIPDQSLIVADYDVNRDYPNDSDKLSKYFGVFGYKGRIPANFIEKMWAKTENQDWEEALDHEMQTLIDSDGFTMDSEFWNNPDQDEDDY